MEGAHSPLTVAQSHSQSTHQASQGMDINEWNFSPNQLQLIERKADQAIILQINSHNKEKANLLQAH